MQILEIQLAMFIAQLRQVLPLLIKGFRKDELRTHPKWGQVIPYGLPPYGIGEPLGWSVRPDIIFTAEGPRVCEFDFVASGRGFTVAQLQGQEVGEFLGAFAEWYKAIDQERYIYATGTKTTCGPERDIFAQKMREEMGVDVLSGNLDVDDPDGRVIDRLYYFSELAAPERHPHVPVITSEPFLDSKIIFALVHATELSDFWTREVGAEGLAFLRRIMPMSVLLRDAEDALRTSFGWLAEDRSNWVVKATEVESDNTWGSRGVMLGQKANRGKFLESLQTGNPPTPKKFYGKNPILQRFTPSVNFNAKWDGLVSGKLRVTRGLFGMESDEVSHRPATQHVHARFGVYFNVVASTGHCFTTPYGVATFRQDPTAHGARDAIIAPFKVV